MNQEIIKQNEIRNAIKQKHHERELQIELDTAVKDKKDLDMHKVAEFLNNKKLKEERLREIQNEIYAKQKIKNLNDESMNIKCVINKNKEMY